MLRIGYVSNGFADHTLEQMVQVLNHLGYQGVGLTLDHIHLDPFDIPSAKIKEVRNFLADAELEPVIETGARYYLDPFRKHRPTMVSFDREARRRRVRYYARALEIAAEIGASVVSLWSGTPQPTLEEQRCWLFLEEALTELLERAESLGVTIGFEPEPGMFIEDLAGYQELKRRLPHPNLKLTLDIGHLACMERPPLEAHIHNWREDIVNVHVEDIRGRRHEHLPFGEGDIDFAPLLKALHEIDYRRLVLVELSRNSAEAPLQAQRSLIYLREAET